MEIEPHLHANHRNMFSIKPTQCPYPSRGQKIGNTVAFIKHFLIEYDIQYNSVLSENLIHDIHIV